MCDAFSPSLNLYTSRILESCHLNLMILKGILLFSFFLMGRLSHRCSCRFMFSMYERLVTIMVTWQAQTFLLYLLFVRECMTIWWYVLMTVSFKRCWTWQKRKKNDQLGILKCFESCHDKSWVGIYTFLIKWRNNCLSLLIWFDLTETFR